jgi:L-glutamine-phosphate cytidylyltransferase
MKAIILAAGKGSRLDQSGETVKCLLKFGSFTLIELQCKYLRQCGVHEISVVVGFEAERVRRTCGPGIEYIENPIFLKTNSLYSLWLARECFSDGFVVINSDVLFHPQLLWDLLTARREDALLVSYREEMEYGDEEMKVKVRGGRLLDISKDMDPAEADGENVGIVKFGASGARFLEQQMASLVENGALRSWAPRAFLEFAKRRSLHVVGTRGFPWTEIDFPEDYLRAQEQIFPQIVNSSAPNSLQGTAKDDDGGRK